MVLFACTNPEKTLTGRHYREEEGGSLGSVSFQLSSDDEIQ